MFILTRGIVKSNNGSRYGSNGVGERTWSAVEDFKYLARELWRIRETVRMEQLKDPNGIMRNVNLVCSAAEQKKNCLYWFRINHTEEESDSFFYFAPTRHLILLDVSTRTFY